MARHPELLIPASSLEVLKTAVIFGADAVYIGGEAFGLRAKAKNFSLDEMREGIEFAHEHDVKVYVTANILAHNYDLAGVREYFEELKDIKPDGLIIADPAIFEIAGEVCPEIERHISTQANNTNYGTFNFWYQMGAKRVVTARELSLKEIKEIRDNIPEDMDIETFIHGAMCYCYSGQCLFSSILGGRSGNRGRCAQPCRMEYESVAGSKKHWLSPKDLCGLTILPELIETGAASFKIEGRMKRPEYAAAVTAAYRKFTDLYCSLGDEGYRAYLKDHPALLAEETERLADIYNRGGFTTGCFTTHNGKSLMSVNRPGHFGVPVGEVVAGGKGEALIRLTKEVQPQDVLELR